MNSKIWIIVIGLFASSILVNVFSIYLRYQELKFAEENNRRVHEENMMIVDSIAKQLKMIEDASRND